MSRPESSSSRIAIFGARTASGPGLGVLAITHYNALLKELRPDRVHILVRGQLVAEGGAVGRRLRQRLDPPGTRPEGIDVEAGVELVEDGDLRGQHAELQRLVALLLATGQVDVEGSVEESLLEPDPGRLVAQRLAQPADVAAA